MLRPDQAMLSALRMKNSIEFAESVRRNKRFRPMRLNAFDYVKSGTTTIEELLRISSQQVEDEDNLPELSQVGREPV